MDTASGRLRTLGAPRKIYVHYMSVGWPCIQTSESEVNNSAIVTTMVSMVQVWAIAERSKRGASPILYFARAWLYLAAAVSVHIALMNCFSQLSTQPQRRNRLSKVIIGTRPQNALMMCKVHSQAKPQRPGVAPTGIQGNRTQESDTTTKGSTASSSPTPTRKNSISPQNKMRMKSVDRTWQCTN